MKISDFYRLTWQKGVLFILPFILYFIQSKIGPGFALPIGAIIGYLTCYLLLLLKCRSFNKTFDHKSIATKSLIISMSLVIVSVIGLVAPLIPLIFVSKILQSVLPGVIIGIITAFVSWPLIESSAYCFSKPQI